MNRKLIYTISALALAAISSAQSASMFVTRSQTYAVAEVSIKTLFHKGSITVNADSLFGANVSNPSAAFGCSLDASYTSGKGWGVIVGLGLAEPLSTVNFKQFNSVYFHDHAGLTLGITAPFNFSSLFTPSVKIANMEAHAL
jgi:hypothetical protein